MDSKDGLPIVTVIGTGYPYGYDATDDWDDEECVEIENIDCDKLDEHGYSGVITLTNAEGVTRTIELPFKEDADFIWNMIYQIKDMVS